MRQRAVLWSIVVELLAGACTGSDGSTEVTTAIPLPDSAIPAFGSSNEAAIAAARTQDPDLENPKVTQMIAIQTGDRTVDLRVQVTADGFCYWYGVGGTIREERLEWRASPLHALVAEVAPSMLTMHGLGGDGAAVLLVAAGDNPQRLRSEAAWAHLCGVAPIQASSGKTTRYRLNRGGNRQANAVLYQIALTRMSSDPRTRAYVTRRRQEGLSTKEIIRVLKRYVAREVYKHLPPNQLS